MEVTQLELTATEEEAVLRSQGMLRLAQERDEAEQKAWESLARYKFQMFGYWAAIWVHLNRIIGDRKPSPFGELVQAARKRGEA